MMDSTQSTDNNSEPPSSSALGSVATSSPTVTSAPPNRSLASRSQRSRRGFASSKSRLSLKIDAECMTNAERTPVTGQSTPASTSSSCSSDVVPWWEVEYRCPPPGHLGAHMVPVSADEQQPEQGAGQSTTSDKTSSTTSSATVNSVPSIFVTPTQTSTSFTPQKLNAGLTLYETPERARRGPHNKLSAIRGSVPCLLVDSSPSQKRKMRPQDPTECEADLFSTPVTKELKRFHESSCRSLKKSALPSRVVTPSTLVQPLTQIGISQAVRPNQPPTGITKPSEKP